MHKSSVHSLIHFYTCNHPCNTHPDQDTEQFPAPETLSPNVYQYSNFYHHRTDRPVVKLQRNDVNHIMCHLLCPVCHTKRIFEFFPAVCALTRCHFHGWALFHCVCSFILPTIEEYLSCFQFEAIKNRVLCGFRYKPFGQHTLISGTCPEVGMLGHKAGRAVASVGTAM